MSGPRSENSDEDQNARRHERPLDKDEVHALRKLLESNKRNRWLRGFIGRTAAWAGGAVITIYTSREFLGKAWTAAIAALRLVFAP